MDIKFRKKVFPFIFFIVILYLAVAGVLSVYYKSVLIKPGELYQGARVSINSVSSLWGDNKPRLNTEHLKFVAPTEVEASEDLVASLEQTDEFSQQLHEIQEQLASLRDTKNQLKESVDQLEQIDQQLNQRELMLNGLNQTYSNVLAHKQVQAMQREQIAVGEDRDIGEITLADTATKTQIEQDEYAQKIPQNVLDNIQRTTGVSPEEINELFNRR